MALTANQLISLALAAAKAPGWIAQAQQALNVLLADLSDTQDLDLCRNIFTTPLIVDNGAGSGSGPYLLPLDYKRAEREGVRYVFQGVPFTLVSIDLVEYYQQVQQPGVSSQPQFFATDTSPLGLEPPAQPIMWLWPPSNINSPLSVQYRRLLPDITDFSTVPWFPHQGYLLKKLTSLAMDWSDDTRAPAFAAAAEAMLNRFMKLTNDDEGRAKTAKLDRRRSGTAYANLKATKNIGWP